MNPFKLAKYSCFYALLFVGLSTVAWAQESTPVLDKDDPNLVLAYQGSAVLTQQEIDAAFEQIPEHLRLLFIRDGEKVDQMVRNLLEIKMLKNDAIAQGLTDEPMVNTRMELVADKELAKIWTQRIPELAPEVDFAAMAREDYLANPKNYDRSASIDITQILISTKERTAEEAMEIALDLRAQLEQEPEMFQKFVAMYSDDETKITSYGQLKKVTKGQMVPSFEKAAFALETDGEISEPVKTKYGVHLIRLDAQHSEGIPSFDEVREEAIEKQKLEYKQIFLRKYLSQLFREPAVFPEGSIEIMAKRHFGEDLELAPDYSEGRSE